MTGPQADQQAHTLHPKRSLPRAAAWALWPVRVLLHLLLRKLGPRLRRLARPLLKLLAALAAGLAVLAGIAWLVVQFAILPRVNEWRGAVERHATQALGVTVRVGSLSARRDGLLPRVTLHELRLLDAQGQTSLVLPQVDARLSLRSLWPVSLWQGEIRLDELTVASPQLDIRRDTQGRILVAGILVGRSGAATGDDSGAPDWLFSQPAIIIRNGTLRWIDEARGAPPLALSKVELSLRNAPSLTGRRHELDISAQPPAGWGEHFTLQARFTQPLLQTHLFDAEGMQALAAPTLTRPGDWRSWRGEIQAELPQADTSPWPRYFDLPFELARGVGSVHASMSWMEGRIEEFAADLDLRQVSARLAPDLEPLTLARLSGRLSASAKPLRNGLTEARLQAVAFSFTTDEGWVWPQADLDLAWRGKPAAKPLWSVLPDLGLARVEGGEFKASTIDLAMLARLATRLPLPAHGHAELQALAPSGLAQQVQLSFNGTPSKPTSYRARGVLKGLTLAPRFAAAAAQPASAAASATTAAASAPTASAPASASAPPDAGEHPGIENADLNFDATERGGIAHLSIKGGALTFPGIFDEARIPLHLLQAQVEWKLDPKSAVPKAEVHVKNGTVANDDLQGTFDAGWQTGNLPGEGYGHVFPGVLKLKANISKGKAVAVARYLPTGITAEARHYVSNAVLAGEVADVNFKIEGDLWHVPAHADEPGAFLINGQVRNLKLAYVPPAAAGAPLLWPLFTELDGELDFNRNTMSIHHAKARLSTVGSGRFELSGVEGRIANLAHDATLVIDGVGRGPLDDLVRYIKSSPIDAFMGHALSDASGEGNVETRLALNLPLNHINDSTVRGNVKLDGNGMRLSGSAPPLSNARGQINFTQRQVQLQAGARALGGETKLEGGSQADGTLRFTGTGTVTGDGLRRYAEGQGSPALARVAARLSGQTVAKLNLGFVRGQQDWVITSNTVGLAMDLPAPLSKRADQQMAMRLQLNPLAGTSPAATDNGATATNGNGVQRDVLRFDLGTVLQAQYIRDTSGPATRVLRGGIGVMQPARLPAQGVDAQVNLAVLDADAWLAVLRTPAAPAATATSAASPAAAGSPVAAAPAAQGDRYTPDSVTLRARELRIAGRHMSAVTLAVAKAAAPSPSATGSGAPAAPGATQWSAQVESDQVKGQVDVFVGGRNGEGLTRVNAKLKRLVLPPATPGANTLDGAAASGEPTVPALNIVADDFQLGNSKLGRLEVQAEPAGAANATDQPEANRAWRLTQLALNNPDATLNATGVWSPSAGAGSPRRTQLDFTLDLRNSGALLTRLGQAQTVRGGKGRIEGKLAWTGSPLAPAIPTLDGQVRIGVDAGQFLKAEPGVARLLGVLSLQSLPRRLTLDFRDIFGEGFAFDHIDGDLSIAQGKASTRNLRMRGVQAVVLMEGEANLVNETQNLHVWVVPEINAGSASLAYAAINPAIGLGTFVAQVLLRKPLIEAGTRQFHVTGSWADPKMEPVSGAAATKPPVQSPSASTPAPLTLPASQATSAASGPAAASSPASAPALLPASAPAALAPAAQPDAAASSP